MRPSLLVALVCCTLAAGAARGDTGAGPLDEKRDQLLEKIARGVDYGESVRAFSALLVERQKLLEPEERARQLAIAAHAWRQAYEKSADGIAGRSCRLNVDPARPAFADQDLLLADWGRVTRAETARLPPKNALDEGEAVSLVEVKGVRGLYRFRADRFAFPGQKLAPAVGDLLLVCENVEPSISRNRLTNAPEPLVPGWDGLLGHGRAIAIGAPPRSVKKSRWDPIHITDNAFFWAVKDVKWKFPPDRFFLTRISVLSDEGNGRYIIEALQKVSWMLEVPPRVKGRELLVPGRIAWVIAGQPRFDANLKKLVLVAEDIEEKYILGVGEK